MSAAEQLVSVSGGLRSWAAQADGLLAGLRDAALLADSDWDGSARLSANQAARVAAGRVERLPYIVKDLAAALSKISAALAEAAVLEHRALADPGNGQLWSGQAQRLRWYAERDAAESIDLVRSACQASAYRLEGLQQPGRYPSVPVDAAPQEVARWWAQLTPAQQLSDLALNGAVLGSTDGVAPAVRDLANRRALATAQQHAASGRRVALARLQDQLRDHPGARLLLFDPQGDGRMAVSFGDISTSDHLAVLVPGVGTDLDNAPALVRKADDLQRASGPGTAVVAWLGYDPPEGVTVTAASTGRAKDGAPLLNRFVLGLRASDRTIPAVTVVAHSYGTVLTGLARLDGLYAQDIVALGSPGMVVDSSSELDLPGHVWVATAADDPIRLAFDVPDSASCAWSFPLCLQPGPRAFGTDPSSAEFGANQLPTQDVSGHSEYLHPGTSTQAAVAVIVAGRGARITHGGRRRAGREQPR